VFGQAMHVANWFLVGQLFVLHPSPTTLTLLCVWMILVAKYAKSGAITHCSFRAPPLLKPSDMAAMTSCPPFFFGGIAGKQFQSMTKIPMITIDGIWFCVCFV
jgi:hypothetical protein